jgi:DNA invertase Pin-like site-specific DNA recombinase
MSQTIGYIRVSSEQQNTERQLQDIELDKCFIDKLSGVHLDRPKLQECLEYVRQGDTLVIHSIDRLARNLRDLNHLVDKLTIKGVSVRFIKEGLTFTGNDDALSTLMLHMMGAFAEFERTMIKSRQREGIDAARKAGKHVGRPCQITPEMTANALERLKAGKSIRQTAMELKVSRPTIYKIIEHDKQRIIREYDEAQKAV